MTALSLLAAQVYDRFGSMAADQRTKHLEGPIAKA
jgi:hypothetical protein